MKRSMTVILSVILMISMTGCSKDYGQEIEKRYGDLENYTTKIRLTINDADYELVQSFQSPDTYRSEVLSPKSMRGTVSVITAEEVTLTGGDFSSVTMPRAVKESLSGLHLKDFFLAYFSIPERQMEVTEDGGILLTHTDAENNPYAAKQVVRLNQKDFTPETMQSYDKDGNEVFRIEYVEFSRK